MLIYRVALIPSRVWHGTGLLRRTFMYVSFLGISDALYLSVFEQPANTVFFGNVVMLRFANTVSYPGLQIYSIALSALWPKGINSSPSL
jgi:hypothetical protein